MGLFDIFKKKKRPETSSDDIDILSVDGLIDFVKSNLDNPTEENVLKAVQAIAAPAEDQDHLTPEGALPWGWHSVHESDIKPIERKYKKYWQVWLDSRLKSPGENLAALEDFVTSMIAIKKQCEKKGECFNYWREELFTNDFLQTRSNELEDLRQNIDKLEAAFQAKADFETNVLPTLEKQLLRIIKENPGILQKDIYKMFAPEGKIHVQEKLYYAEKSKKIRREKSGNSYKLYIK